LKKYNRVDDYKYGIAKRKLIEKGFFGNNLGLKMDNMLVAKGFDIR